MSPEKRSKWCAIASANMRVSIFGLLIARRTHTTLFSTAGFCWMYYRYLYGTDFALYKHFNYCCYYHCYFLIYWTLQVLAAMLCNFGAKFLPFVLSVRRSLKLIVCAADWSHVIVASLCWAAMRVIVMFNYLWGAKFTRQCPGAPKRRIEPWSFCLPALPYRWAKPAYDDSHVIEFSALRPQIHRDPTEY